MNENKAAISKTPGRRTQSRYAGKYYWDKLTLEQRRRARLQMLERENYTTLADFENMPIAVDTSGTRRQGRPPRTPSSIPKPSSSTKIVIGIADEGLKRANRKETRSLVAQKSSFADILAGETDREAISHDTSKTSPSYYYLTCTASSQLGSGPSPSRHFCSICGYKGLYTCIDCGMRYCSLPCRSTHVDTRCLKHVA